MEIAVIGNEAVITAFRLGGVARSYEETEAAAKLGEILADETIGLLIVTEHFADENRKVLEKHRLSRTKNPIILEVPDESGSLPERENPIDRLLRRAIGADIGEKQHESLPS